MFLEYEPIGFVTPAKYNASHHIPEVKVYERGTIYRILLGTYTNRTNGGYLFKGAYPLGYEKVEGKYAYYAGGYRTLDEARAAQEQMKKKGRHFIVGPLADKAVADKVAEAVMQQNASLEVKIAEIVE